MTSIDLVAGSGKFMLDGGSVDTFATMVRNTDSGSRAGMPGRSLPAGPGPTGLPIGLELDGRLRDRRLLAIAMAFEKVLGGVAALSALTARAPGGNPSGRAEGDF